MRAELINNDYPIHVLSSEHFCSRLLSTDEIKRLHGFLTGLYTEIEVVVYFRRQDQYQVSSYSTLLKSGWNSTEVFPLKENFPALDYYNICNMWAGVFGKDNLKVRLFDRDKLKAGSVISDFLSFLEQDINTYKLPERESNPSLQPIAQNVLVRVNELTDEGLVSNEMRSELIVFLENRYGGTSKLPTKNYAMKWYKRFEKANENLYAEYLNDEFSTDFEMYPEDWIESTFDAKIMATVIFEFFSSNYQLKRRH